MLKPILVLAAALAAVNAAPAKATPTPIRTVSAAGLDLASPAGRAQLDRRVAAAVRDLCGGAAPTDLQGRADVAQCRTATLALATRPNR